MRKAYFRNYIHHPTSKMDNLKWRKCARIVAYMELIMSGLHLILAAVTIIPAAAFTAVVVKNPDMLRVKKSTGTSLSAIIRNNSIEASAAAVWVVIAIWIALTIIQLWAAIQLMSSTGIGIGPGDALKKAARWRMTTVLFLIMKITGCMMSKQTITFALFVLVNISFLSIVHRYMEELYKRLSRPMLSYDNDDSTGVTGSKA